MDCCNSAVSALKEQLFFSGMQYMKREKGQLFVEPLFREFFQRRAAGCPLVSRESDRKRTLALSLGSAG